MWGVIYFGLMLPTLINLLKFVLTFEAPKFSFVVTEYLKLHSRPLPFNIPKTVYKAFFLPLFAFGSNSRRDRKAAVAPLLYFSECGILRRSLIFFSENIKNGVAYAMMPLAICYVALLFQYRARIRLKGALPILVMVVALGFLPSPTWKKQILVKPSFRYSGCNLGASIRSLEVNGGRLSQQCDGRNGLGR
jgi:hypothetical protein